MSKLAKSGAFRPLLSFETRDYAAHLARLPQEDLRARFRRVMTETAMRDHAEAALTGDAHVIGWFHRGELRAAAEVALLGDGTAAEGAFEVEAEYRGHGIGSMLIGRCLLWARNRGATSLHVFTERSNVPMLAAARREGAKFTFELNDVDGEIAAKRPDLLSYLQEFEEDEMGWFGWGVQRMMATAQQFNPWRAMTPPPAAPGEERRDA